MEKTFEFYSATVEFHTEDEKSGKTKKIKEQYLVKAVSPTDVETQIVKDLEGTIPEYKITNIAVSKFIRVIKPDNVELNG